jgi:enoyl-CoA hydratase/carnithine racemase
MASPDPRIRIERDGAVLTVTLAAPDSLNAQTPTLWLALAQIAQSVPSDVRVVVLAADGRAFSAGLHRGMLTPAGLPGEPTVFGMAAGDPAGFDAEVASYQEGFTAWGEIGALVVAAVQGHAIGAGFQLALGADLRVVAEDVSFAMREPSLGMIPDLGGSRRLVEIVGPARALDICATTRAVGAQEALAIGLAQRIAPVADLRAVTRAYVDELLASEAGALRELKPLLRGALGRSPHEQLAAERSAQQRLLARFGPA